MTFLTPGLAALAAAIAVPTLVILYFLKLRRRDVEVATTLLWKKAIQDLQANAPFQRLRRNVLLFLQLLALACVLFALAQPRIRGTQHTGTRHVILIDRSASMSTLDGEPGAPVGRERTRLEAAKRIAIEQVVENLREPDLLGSLGIFGGGAQTADQAMVIAFGAGADVRQPFTSDKATLRRAIESIEPTDEPTSFRLAYDLARAFTGSATFEDQVAEERGYVPVSSATMHIVSDGNIPDAEGVENDPSDIILFYPVGEPTTGNMGITAVRAVRAFDDPAQVSVFVGIQSTIEQAREVDVELSLDDGTRLIRRVSVPAAQRPAGGSADAGEGSGSGGAGGERGGRGGGELPRVEPQVSGVVFTFRRPEGAVATVDIVGANDVFLADDRGYVIVPPASRMSVAVVSAGNAALRLALGGLNLEPLRFFTPGEFQRLSDGQTVNGFTLGQFDVVVYDGEVLPTVLFSDGTRGPGLPPGRALVFGAIPPGFGIVERGEGRRESGSTVFIDWERTHAALRYANLNSVRVARSRVVQIADGAPVRSIALGSDGPLILTGAAGRTRAILTAFNPLDSDWPFDPGYVLFLAGALRDLSGEAGSDVEGLLRPGQIVSSMLPPGARNAELVLPDNTVAPVVPGDDGTVNFGPISSRGIYTLRWDGPRGAADGLVGGRSVRLFASNIASGEESDLGAVRTLKLAGAVAVGQTTTSGDGVRDLWPWFILIALLVVMIEWWIYNRKVQL